MLRFIFVCMGIVALSMLSIGMQFMTDGIGDAQTQIAERNTQPQDTVVAVQTNTDQTSPEALNEIDTAAGDLADTGFGASFTDAAPKALAEAAPAADLPMATDSAN